jgi:hypothetical protein
MHVVRSRVDRCDCGKCGSYRKVQWRTAWPGRLNSPACRRCLTTSVGTRTSEATQPARAAASRKDCCCEPVSAAMAFLAGSYTAINNAVAGATPKRFPLHRYRGSRIESHPQHLQDLAIWQLLKKGQKARFRDAPNTSIQSFAPPALEHR